MAVANHYELKSTPSASVGENEFFRTIRRQSYAETLQNKWLREGYDFIVMVTGPDYRTLRIVGASLTKPAADQFRNDKAAVDRWRELGFDLLELTDGQGQSWSLQIAR